MYYKILLPLIFFNLLFSCSGNNSSTKNTSPSAMGKKLLIDNCGACHNMPSGNSTGVAPSFLAIKQSYNSTSLEQFQEDMIQFISQPSKESSKMKQAVKEYGLMPKMGFNESDIRSIADYLYNTDLENFESKENDSMPEKVTINALEERKQLALKTKSILGKNLTKAIKEYGPEGAISFCNEKALFLTDSMARELHAKIKRVTNKPRNSQNQATEREILILNSLELAENAGGVLKQFEGKKIGYFKIETNEMCLKCHGDFTENISKKTAEKISQLYPKDQAIGYKSNELRGMWMIELLGK